MTHDSSESINFHTLDDVLLAPPDQADRIRDILNLRPIDELGPVLEYALQQPHYADILPAVDALPNSNVTVALQSILQDNSVAQQLRTTSCDPLRVEFAALRSRDSLPEQAGWRAFLKRFEGAARQAGFGNSIAAGFVGTLRELVENLDIHSEAPDSGIVGYAFSNHTFEFAIADTGIGVLASLRHCQDYIHLNDHADALLTALTDGESRFGRNTNHGHGFRQLFVSLANQYGCLRFRSGDHRLEIEGSSPNLPTATVAQTASFQGFMASIACRSAPPRNHA